MARKALDTVVLGLHGEIAAGEEIPETYEDLLGGKHKTDFDRLEELGYVAPLKGAKKKAGGEEIDESEPETEAEVEADAEVEPEVADEPAKKLKSRSHGGGRRAAHEGLSALWAR